MEFRLESNILRSGYTLIVGSVEVRYDFTPTKLVLTVLRIRSNFYWTRVRGSGLDKSDPDPDPTYLVMLF